MSMASIYLLSGVKVAQKETQKIRWTGMQCEGVIRRNHALSFSRKGILHCFLSVAKKSPSHKASMGGKQRLPPVIMTNSWRAGRGSHGVAPPNPSDFGSPLTSSSRACRPQAARTGGLHLRPSDAPSPT
ncbi:hypothetical protein BHM03_00007607 [Ensete ventricosum]|nr:hypothetical protein BHM03_00007607 [Ensete ventricosum]